MMGAGWVPADMRRAALEALGLRYEVSDRTIRRAYRQIARDCHPDHHPDDPSRTERFRLAAEAYEVLTHPRPGGRYSFGLLPDRQPSAPSSTHPSGAEAGSDYRRWWMEQWRDLI